MNIKGHIVGGLLFTGVYWLSDRDLSLCIFVTGTLGAMIPDLDHKDSTISKLIRINPVTMIQEYIPNRVTKHRGKLLHSIFTLVISATLALFFRNWVTIGLYMGILSHHVLDYPIQNYFRGLR